MNEQYCGENRRKRKAFHRTLIDYRVLAKLVMIFTGWLMVESMQWAFSIPHEILGLHHAGIIAAINTPAAGMFKFAFDFALDGKINNNLN